AGEGCARLLRFDVPRGALLLEHLGPSLADLGLPMARRHEILCDLAQRVWRPGAGLGLPTGAEKARSLARYTGRAWEEAGRPCARETIEHALRCAAARE